jgi:hypothetical protein
VSLFVTNSFSPYGYQSWSKLRNTNGSISHHLFKTPNSWFLKLYLISVVQFLFCPVQFEVSYKNAARLVTCKSHRKRKYIIIEGTLYSEFLLNSSSIYGSTALWTIQRKPNWAWFLQLWENEPVSSKNWSNKTFIESNKFVSSLLAKILTIFQKMSIFQRNGFCLSCHSRVYCHSIVFR